MANRNKSIRDYQREIKALSPVVPALRRLRRRKTLKPHEKALVSRARNAVDTVAPRGSGVHLAPINRRQSRLLKDKDAVPATPKRGMPEIRAVVSPRRTTPHVRNGELVIERGHREWHTRRVNFAQRARPLLSELITAIYELRKRTGTLDGFISIFLWQARGFSEPTAVLGPDLEEDEGFSGEILAKAQEYMADLPETFFGLIATKMEV